MHQLPWISGNLPRDKLETLSSRATAKHQRKGGNQDIIWQLDSYANPKQG